MKHLKALAIKLVSLFIILWVTLGLFFDIATSDILLITLVFGLIEYVVGDLILLRYTNNTVGTAGDFGLALLIIWLMVTNMTPEDTPFMAALIASVGVAIFEYFFHKYVYNNVYDHEDRQPMDSPGNMRYQTESSKELSDMKNKKDE